MQLRVVEWDLRFLWSSERWVDYVGSLQALENKVCSASLSTDHGISRDYMGWAGRVGLDG